ncbi:MAG: alpha/beta hydrolase [Candidatus Daviesbacteria bacterium]|nr:alpha/beta hydrolase [Candidatus Daviesbacteria bacterium]
MQKRKNMAGQEKEMESITHSVTRSVAMKSQAIIKIIVLHGWSYSAKGVDPLEKWNNFVQELGLKGYQPTLLKIPGLTKNLKEVWTLEKYVDWLNTEVKNEKVILLGHSNGGRISLAFTQKYPEKVSKLILIDSAGIYHNELPIRIKRFIFKNLAKFGKRISKSEKLKLLLYKLAREGDYKNATYKQRQTMINLINTDLTSLMSSIKTPTIIIWGEEDKVTPLSDGKNMGKLIKNSKLYVIKSAKHSPQFTHTKEVVNIINEHI